MVVFGEKDDGFPALNVQCFDSSQGIRMLLLREITGENDDLDSSIVAVVTSLCGTRLQHREVFPVFRGIRTKRSKELSLKR